ncbi:MAG: biotin synthase BioB [Endomicrobiales bacterium]|nr:biotin synthase BioB [Endomicrobiales bacterium]
MSIQTSGNIKKSELERIFSNVVKEKKITFEEAACLFSVEVEELLGWADKIREHFKGKKIKLCSIINAKSGLCSQDCKFCAQSSHYKTKIDTYPLVNKEEIKKGLNQAVNNSAGCYGIVTSGHSLSEKEIDVLCLALSECNGSKINLSASLGSLNRDLLRKLQEAGLRKYHHNLETSESFFPDVCTTQSYSQRVETVKLAKELGLKVCCGGIFGLGETKEQRLELAFTLRELDVDSVPLNFLNPIPGTPLENSKNITPMEILQTIAVFRFVLPDKDINICGGREVNLGDLQSRIFRAGANGMMVGGYLTTSGRSVEQDLKMINDLEFEIYE